MVSVTADQIRRRLGLTVADISDEDVLAFRDEAVVQVNSYVDCGVGSNIVYGNCIVQESTSNSDVDG